MKITLYMIYVISTDTKTGASTESILGDGAGNLWVATSCVDARLKAAGTFGAECMSGKGIQSSRYRVHARIVELKGEASPPSEVL